MKITSIQKVIKVGSSLAVTIPAKEAKAAGVTVGSDVKVSAELVNLAPTAMAKKLDAEYQVFKEQYGETLKNLASR